MSLSEQHHQRPPKPTLVPLVTSPPDTSPSVASFPASVDGGLASATTPTEGSFARSLSPSATSLTNLPLPPLSATSSMSSVSSTSRFHEALTTIPSRHQTSDSVSSSSSSGSNDAFHFPPDSATFSSAKAFDLLQKELVGESGMVGLGLAERDDADRSPPSGSEQGSGSESQKFYDEPETLDDFIQAEIINAEAAARKRALVFGSSKALNEERNGTGSASSSTAGSVDLHPMMGGFGRPASMAMVDEEDAQNIGFLLSPPSTHVLPPLSASPTINDSATLQSPSEPSGRSPATSFGFPGTGPTPKKDRGRTFPAPLLLKGDKPFSPGSSPVLGSVAPLTIRKTSVSAGSTAVPSTSTQAQPHPSSSRPPWTSSTTVSSAAPPTRSTAPYQQHRQQSSQSLSQSQSSIVYNHSHTPSASSGAASPGVGGSAGSHSASSSVNQSVSSQTMPHDAPIAPHALLFLIRSLRSVSQPMGLSQSQGPPSRAGTPLFTQSSKHQRMKSAGSATSDNEEGGHSPTRPIPGGKLDTVDLSHKRVAEVPIELIDELSNEVEKFALGYNLLKDLPTYFSALTRLRYLNVRVNLMTIFPQVLCEMPGLEILDISRNKIRRLPSVPGTLLNLKVFSIAKNRVKRLPQYVVQMSHLKVFKIDHNPLEWPPKEVTNFPTSASGVTYVTGADGESRRPAASKMEEAEEMAKWLAALTKWMRENGDRRTAAVRTSLSLLPSEPLPATLEQHQSDEERESTQDDQNSLGRPGNFRFDSNRGGMVAPRPRPFVGPSRSSPPDEDGGSRNHSRNASHSTMQSVESELRPGLRAKKSLPDLRQPHADILAERRTGSAAPADENVRSKLPPTIAAARRPKHPGIQHTNSARPFIPTQPSSAAGPSTAPSSTIPSPTTRLAPRPTQFPNALSKSAVVRRPTTPNSAVRPDFDQTNSKRPDIDRTPSGGFDRNSGAYFRRLSMLPASTISKAVPVTLLEFADAIRGILFSLSQVYTALRQFVVFASQDRLPAPLARLMGMADGSMSLLINALDRFDSLSRRGTPEASIVRDIFVTCRDNVTIFHKLVSALAPELKSLISTADVRYTRTLLLMLYGSTGEIAKSWNAVTPLLAEMSELNEDTSLATLILHPPTPSPTNPNGASRSGQGAPIQRMRSKTRRHAGSFSVEDVQLGAVLPPASVPALPTTVAFSPEHSQADEGSFDGGTIKARPPKMSRPKPPSITVPPIASHRELIVNALEQPLTPLPYVGEPGGYIPNGRGEPMPRAYTNGHQASTSADEAFLSMVETTTGIAYDVYGMLINSFDEAAEGRDGEGAAALMRELGPRRTKELTDLCILGNEVTTKLTGSLGRVRGPDRNYRPSKFSAVDAKRLGDDAYTFVQTVIRFAKLVKAISLEHGFAPRVREGVGQLTISTREFAKALTTNTSFRPIPPGQGPSTSSNFPTRALNDPGQRG